MKVTHELMVCHNCVGLLSNGGWDDGTDAAERCSERMLAKWGELTMFITPEYDESKYLELSIRDCDGCGDSTHGERQSAVILQ